MNIKIFTKTKLLFLILASIIFMLLFTACGARSSLRSGERNADLDSSRAGVADSYRLYFADPAQSALITEDRSFTKTYGDTMDDNLARAREALDSLIGGPSDTNNRATVNKTSKINFMRHEADDILHIDFDDGFISDYEQLGTNPQMTMNSIFSTVTQFKPFRGVRMTVNNKPLTLNNVVYRDPILKNYTGGNNVF